MSVDRVFEPGAGLELRPVEHRAGDELVHRGVEGGPGGADHHGVRELRQRQRPPRQQVCDRGTDMCGMLVQDGEVATGLVELVRAEVVEQVDHERQPDHDRNGARRTAELVMHLLAHRSLRAPSI